MGALVVTVGEPIYQSLPPARPSRQRLGWY